MRCSTCYFPAVDVPLVRFRCCSFCTRCGNGRGYVLRVLKRWHRVFIEMNGWADGAAVQMFKCTGHKGGKGLRLLEPLVIPIIFAAAAD